SASARKTWRNVGEVSQLSSTDAAAPATSTEEAGPAPLADDAREEVIAELREELGDAIVGTHIDPGHDVWVRVTRESWQAAGMALRERGGFRMFEFLSAIDWMPSPYGKSEDSPTDVVLDTEPGEIVTGVAGGDTRFQVF